MTQTHEAPQDGAHHPSHGPFLPVAGARRGRVAAPHRGMAIAFP
ncbi:MAG: hypothetical protein ACT4P0_09265 [Panacagrimonas sp.]